MKFRKKPVVIEALQWTGANYAEISTFFGFFNKYCKDVENILHIETLEGTMKANVNDWIIRGVKGEFYPCKPDVFDRTYDRVSE